MITEAQIRSVERHAAAGSVTEELVARLRALRNRRRPFFLTTAELDEIARWKLEGQYGRANASRTALEAEHVKIVTRAAFEIRSVNRSAELAVRAALLTSLPSVGMAVASAVLTLTDPAEYAVIDFRVWRQLFDSERTSFSVGDYRQYMEKVWVLKDRLGWDAQKIDLCIWEYDRRHSRAVSEEPPRP